MLRGGGKSVFVSGFYDAGGGSNPEDKFVFPNIELDEKIEPPFLVSSTVSYFLEELPPYAKAVDGRSGVFKPPRGAKLPNIPLAPNMGFLSSPGPPVPTKAYPPLFCSMNALRAALSPSLGNAPMLLRMEIGLTGVLETSDVKSWFEALVSPSLPAGFSLLILSILFYAKLC